MSSSQFQPSLQRTGKSVWIRYLLTLILLGLYIAYLFFVTRNQQGPVDYETFMRLGRTFLEGGEVYTENSYYPLPYVGVFALLSLLPKSISLVLWLGAPVVVVLVISRFRPWALLFAPVFSHFVGGQSSVFGLLGFFGYRRNLDPSNYPGGVFLSLTLLKPQLAIIPLGYAMVRWIQYYRMKRRVPRQLVSFALTSGLIFLPGFIVSPTWVSDWLSQPRPMFSRALSGAVPRLLLLISSPENALYWILWTLLSVLLIGVVWKFKGKSHSLDILILGSFIVSPLVHDYDLIQLVPVILGPWMPAASLVLSLPGWWTIFTSYANDAAWVSFVVIAPGLLITYLLQYRKGSSEGDASDEPSVPDLDSGHLYSRD
jgi:hypothetical protein